MDFENEGSAHGSSDEEANLLRRYKRRNKEGISTGETDTRPMVGDGVYLSVG